jgi:2-C-methyl-D-erythritol 4-phosphate cytidylyltransferase
MDALAASSTVGRAVVAVPAGSGDEIASLAPDGLELELVEGGATRAESVANALAAAACEIAVVHDAARPLVTPQLIDRLVDVLVADAEVAGVIAATPVHDTVKRVVRGKQRIGRTERRDELWAAQTPQVFRSADLRAAHDADPATVAEATDDAMLVEQAGGIVLVEPAPAWNLKVTTPDDLRLVELLLTSRN